MLKISLAAGVALASGGMPNIADASSAKKAASRPDYAKDRFLKSMNCSQAVLETYSPEMGLPAPMARRVAAAFAGGMGMGCECGAVTGALMVIGAKYGKTRDKDSRADEQTFKKVAQFTKEFKERHQHLNCSALLGVDMGTPEGVKQADRKGYFTSRCPEYVKSAAEILEKLLA